MVVRPTENWRQYVAQEARQVASGELDAECASAQELYPEAMLVRTDEVLQPFEREIAALTDPADDEIFAAIERVVLALNKVNDDYDGAVYETDEREQLCEYIERSLAEAGIDIDAFAGRHSLTRHQITDKWRDW
ncbi:hypothetical protein E1264_31690 [Actinomadura sp. KC216]|uniref:hypothetical protein n=1 Tax=Actinomadura sp. KC216 TaxID=2530370 RepID=UPI001044811E|nr:hypothetical protein [Actinomadura sp. KC216]TDB82204.1 hypothetical protein E1264_31690 [Actinomadura sp. KC216]